MSAECTTENIPPGYKQTEVGVIPEDWNPVTIGDITIKVGSGITPRGGSSNYKEYGRPFVRSQNVGWGILLLADLVYIDEDTHKSFSSTELKQGDVLLNITGASIGRCTIADERLAGGNVNQHVCIVRTKSTEVDSQFLNFILLSSLGQQQIDSFQAGGNREGLNFGQIRSIKFPLPPTKVEQEDIAEALSDADALIESLEQLIAKKRQIKQGAMQELLTGKRRLPGFEIKRGYKHSEVGEIPEDWESSKIGDYAFVTKLAGFEYTLYFDYSKSGPIIAIRALNIKDGTLKLDDIHTIPKETSDSLPRSKLKKGDLVMSYVGTLGRVAIIPEDDMFHLAPNVAKLSTNREIISPVFLSQFLNSYQGQKNIFDAAASTTQAALSMSNLRAIFFARPPYEEQEAIATILSEMDSEITALEEKLTKARQIKQGMMQELLKGRIRLI